MSPLTRYTLLPLLLLTVACADGGGGQVGEETITCKALLTDEIQPTDATPLGFTVMDILNFAEATHQSELRWADESTTTVHLSLSFTGGATYQERAWIDEDATDGAPEPARDNLDCPDILELEMMVAAQSDDGALDENWLVLLQAPTNSAGVFFTDLDTIAGSLQIESYAPVGQFDGHRAFIDLRVDAEGIRGEIHGQAETTSAGGPDSAVSATSYPIASIGPADS